MTRSGMKTGKAGLVQHDTTHMLMNCMFDSIVTKTVFFVALLYTWTELVWPAIASSDLVASSSADKISIFQEWHFVPSHS
jgi:hypothetical protein